MGDTKIPWTTKSWNCCRGCQRVSRGCGDGSGGGCYAERMAHRFSGKGQPYEGLTKLTKAGPRWTGRARFVADKLKAPLGWRKPSRVFVNSMGDLFHADISNEQIAAVFGIMAACPQHTFQVLTKRPERMREWFGWVRQLDDGLGDIQVRRCILHVDSFIERARHVDYPPWPLPNVSLGVSVENQQTAHARIPLLLQTPAAVRWVSVEPLLGPVDLDQWSVFPCGSYEDHVPWLAQEEGEEDLRGGIDWIVVGGESGPGARPFDIAWMRCVRDQCRNHRCPVFCKQLGANPVENGKRLHLEDRAGADPTEWPAGEEWPRVYPRVAANAELRNSATCASADPSEWPTGEEWPRQSPEAASR